jgi:hypothetical protein
VLNDGEAEKSDWDVYVNNPDYNAYAAALLLLADPGANSPTSASATRAPSVSAASRIPPRHQPAFRELGPVLIIEHDSLFAAFSTLGAAVHVGTPFFCDWRYYGMQPLWIEKEGIPLLELPPYQWPEENQRAALVDPAQSAWIPYIELEGQRYCVRRYTWVEVRHLERGVQVDAEGQLERCEPLPRWARGLNHLSSQYLGLPAPLFCSRPLRGVRLRRRLSWDSECGVLHATAQVIGSLPSEATLHQDTQRWPAISASGLPPLVTNAGLQS